MTDNEIIKALELCTSGDIYCKDCPYTDVKRCRFVSLCDALDLINRQKAEKEALINGQETLQKYIAEQKAEIDGLQQLVNLSIDTQNEMNDTIIEQKAEIERLNVVLCKDCKHRHKVNTGLAIWQACHKLNRQTDDDFYCAYGERKNGDG